MKDKLNARQRKFAEYYAQNGNTVQSAIMAGYSENYANARAYELLENVGVAKYIKQLSDRLKDERIMSAKDRQVALSDIARNDGQDTSDRIRAIDTLNKMTGEYTVKVDAKVEQSEKLSDVFRQLGGEGLSE
ncbi:terminase small subunit [Ruminococcus bromii]|uniref:terminase small subunit n=1 Tax=Ruminococcus bromii TaxID=40518 RepID=UPI003F810520